MSVYLILNVYLHIDYFFYEIHIIPIISIGLTFYTS
jgi:hypothetical protein